MAKDIVDLAELSGQEEVLEIGGGFGVLTQRIAEKARHVHVIEIDPSLVKALRDVAKDFNNVSIIEGDALTVGGAQVEGRTAPVTGDYQRKAV